MWSWLFGGRKATGTRNGSGYGGSSRHDRTSLLKGRERAAQTEKTMALFPHSSHKLSTASTMERLQPDLLTQVLEFVELPERLQLCRCSTILLRTITKDCPALWVNIEFPQCTKCHFRFLTDDMLAALLKRVNARRVTKVLDLRCCYMITGSGLAPLRQSHVLETVDLGPNLKIDFGHLSSILSTTIPYKLLEVKLDGHIMERAMDSHPALIRKLLHGIRSARLKDAQSIMCSSCHHPVCDESMQIVPNVMGVPSTRCSECKNYFCRRANCNVAVLDCKECGIASCKECDVVRRCTACAHSWCKWCGDVGISPPCVFCNETFCWHCQRFFTCVTCNTTVCESCKEQENYPIVTCGMCGGEKCVDCCEIVFCKASGYDVERDTGTFCSECIDFKRCGCCLEDFCDLFEECKNELSHCNDCEKDFCSKQTCPSVDGGICSICAAKKRPAKRRKTFTRRSS